MSFGGCSFVGSVVVNVRMAASLTQGSVLYRLDVADQEQSVEFLHSGSVVLTDSSTMSLDRYGRLKSPSPKREVKR